MGRSTAAVGRSTAAVGRSTDAAKSTAAVWMSTAVAATLKQIELRVQPLVDMRGQLSAQIVDRIAQLWVQQLADM
jgi:hypothetical protein